jgi:hypothetical protein
MKEGDTIKCHDPDDMINAMHDLAKEGIETDFMYEKDGENGYWLVVTKGDKHGETV